MVVTDELSNGCKLTKDKFTEVSNHTHYSYHGVPKPHLQFGDRGPYGRTAQSPVKVEPAIHQLQLRTLLIIDYTRCMKFVASCHLTSCMNLSSLLLTINKVGSMTATHRIPTSVTRVSRSFTDCAILE